MVTETISVFPASVVLEMPVLRTPCTTWSTCPAGNVQLAILAIVGVVRVLFVKVSVPVLVATILVAESTPESAVVNTASPSLSCSISLLPVPVAGFIIKFAIYSLYPLFFPFSRIFIPSTI